MCVCVCVCMYICMYVYMYVCVFVLGEKIRSDKYPGEIEKGRCTIRTREDEVPPGDWNTFWHEVMRHPFE